jgi:uncharacterized protein YjdB
MRAFILAVTGLAIVAACSSVATTAIDTKTPVASVSITLPSSSLLVGQTQRAIGTARDANGAALADRPIKWQSSSVLIASIDDSGLILGVAPGDVVLQATSEGVSAGVSMAVTAPVVHVAAVSVALAASSLIAGDSTQASATLRDGNGAVLSGRAVTWQSSNTAVATASSSGMIHALAAGSVTITASSEGQSGTAALTIAAQPPPPVASITVSPAAPALEVGTTVQLSAVLRDANGNVLTGRPVAWSSTNTSAATVSSSGLVAALAAGSATIAATSGGVNGTTNVTVTAPSGTAPIFSDDFESGSLTKWNESNSTTQTVVNDAASAHSGARFMRMTYGLNGGDGGWLNKYLTPGFSQLYVRYYARFSTNFVGGTKLVALRGAPIGQPTLGLGRAGICPNGRDSFTADLVTQFAGGDQYPTKMYAYWQDMWADSNGQCWGRYGPTPTTWPYFTPMPEMTKGVWHKIELTAKANSSATTADGVIRFWIDGVKYGEWTGIRFGDPNYVDFEVLTISGSGNTTQIQYIDIDDLILTAQFPSQSQP